MIIISDTPNQLGNQLWAYSNMITLAKECNCKIIIVLSRDYYNMLDLKLLRGNKKVKFYPDNSMTARIIKNLSRFFRYKLYATYYKIFLRLLPVHVIKDFINENKFQENYKQHHLYFMNSWEQRLNKQSFIKHNLLIHSLILPNCYIRDEVERQMNELKVLYPIIIGVHIRRGDYKQFMNGKYYFTDEVYSLNMYQLQKIFNPSEVLFYIFSNELIDLENFCGLKVFYKRDQNPIADIWAMSQCDLLFGPVSTFSMWASFWNRVPLCFIDNTGSKLTLNKFRPVIAQDSFGEVDSNLIIS